ncbi:sugar phosphate nucleotidyltransferase [Spirulina sp. 06S082]|uniref:sugar phosphate nucleotidyltransferase n=1 Tax=Spirulina sp. 06S082 TaxID=3110248 RepID=UPI002B1F0C00|nr:sugar phosphate nucleotidyltransferase [Spirulina sp. 06S082]MEA5468845.1 sugar phosphate nucleotidyltransferase [Spirulina sp. 06S082]
MLAGKLQIPEGAIGLIPAAGEGKRLGLPYPKELYPVIRENRYKPISQFVLDEMVGANLHHIVFVINESKHQLIGYFGNGHRFGCHISYVVQEIGDRQGKSTSPGLAHALDSAYHLTRGKTVFFGMADTIMQPEGVFRRLSEIAQPEIDGVLALFGTENPEKFGMVRSQETGRILEIVDKPQHTHLTKMWGCMMWRSRFTEYLHQCVSQGISDFAAIMNRAIAEGLNFHGLDIVDGTYIDLGTYDEIMLMDRRFRES